MRRCISVFFILIAALMFRKVQTWGSNNKVLLRDVTAITLHKGQMTTGRRSSPVPQLKCIGGSAGCYKFAPQTVQCRNVGFDGHEVQWQCKCDMDDSYRFGKIQVTCEGYDYPDDPYILKGSCGLEYTIDYTKAGNARSNDYAPSWTASTGNSDGGGWLFFFILIFVIVFLICKMGGSRDSGTPYPEPDHSDHRSDSHRSRQNNPPPYGFKRQYTQPQPEHQPPPPTYADATQGHHRSSTYTRNDHHSETRNNSPYGGFWSGLGLGGIGGYLFGSRQRQRHYGNYGFGGGGYGGYNRGWGSSWGNNGGWSSGGSWGSSSSTYRRSTGSSSSGTSRTASGYGGTSRR